MVKYGIFNSENIVHVQFVHYGLKCWKGLKERYRSNDALKYDQSQSYETNYAGTRDIDTWLSRLLSQNYLNVLPV